MLCVLIMKFFIILNKPENQMDKILKKARKKFIINIVFPSVLAVLLFVVTLFFIVIPQFKNSILDKKREMIAELTNTTTSILEKYYKDEMAGLISREEAQNTAMSRIEYLRYGDENKDYFWVTDLQPVMVVHPYRPELNGTDLSDFEDSHGKKLFVECVNVVKQKKHGYVEYMWQWKDDPNLIVPKLSYVKLFEPWGWIVGTGIYIEDVKNEISRLINRFIIISVVIALLIIVILFWVGRQSFNIEKKRIAAEVELNKSKEKYRSLVDASTEGLIMVIDDKISFINPIFEKMSGYSKEQIFNKRIESFLNIPKKIINDLNSEKVSINQTSFECELTTSYGMAIDVIININSFKFYEQKTLIFSLKDVSSDKLVKEELLSSREKFQSLMDRLNQGIFRTSIDTKGKFLEANQTALAIFGYSKFSDIQNMYILDFFVEKYDKLTFRNNLLKEGFIKNQLIKLRKKSGEYVYAVVSLIVISDSAGNPKFCDGIIQDISVDEGVNSDLDSINAEYISFMQQLLIPVTKFCKNAVVCNYSSKIGDLINKMNHASVDFALVEAENGSTIGYVENRIIRERVFNKKDLKEGVYVYMNSPLNFIDAKASVLELLNYYAINKNVEYVVVKDYQNSILGFIDKKDLVVLNDFLPLAVVNSVDRSKSIDELKVVYNKYISFILPVARTSTDAELLLKSLSFISDLICKKLIEMGLEMFGAAPVDFCFVTLGSEARQEQTLNTDQDNAIIFENVESSKLALVKEYFIELSNFICDSLNEVGFKHCKGNIMAKNTEYCQPYSMWENYFAKWINNGTGKDLLDISIFFDMRAVYGKESLVKELKNKIKSFTIKNPAYLFLLAQDTIKLKPQVGFWGNILLETAGSPPETVNIKETIMPIVNFARIYALNNQIEEASTIKRLKILKDKNIISLSSYQNIVQAYKYLQSMRLNHQSILVTKGIPPDNLISTKNISDLEKTIIKKILSNINIMLSKLSYDFKGTM